MRGFFKALWRAMRQLFHEATGTFFLLFAAFGGVAAWRSWHRGPPTWPTWFALGYALLMAVFGVTSFRMARRVR